MAGPLSHSTRATSRGHLTRATAAVNLFPKFWSLDTKRIRYLNMPQPLPFNERLCSFYWTTMQLSFMIAIIANKINIGPKVFSNKSQNPSKLQTSVGIILETPIQIIFWQKIHKKFVESYRISWKIQGKIHTINKINIYHILIGSIPPLFNFSAVTYLAIEIEQSLWLSSISMRTLNRTNRFTQRTLSFFTIIFIHV